MHGDARLPVRLHETFYDRRRGLAYPSQATLIRKNWADYTEQGDGDRALDKWLERTFHVIGAARQDKMGRGRIGAMFLDEAARTIHALVAAGGLDPPATHDLVRAYASACSDRSTSSCRPGGCRSTGTRKSSG